jgi:hypothetical protein
LIPTAFFLPAYRFFSSFNFEKSYSFLIKSRLLFGRFPRGNNPNDEIGFSIAVDYNQQSGRGADAQKDQSLFPIRMLRVIEQPRRRIVECAQRFFKPNPVLSAIGFILTLILIEPQHL